MAGGSASKNKGNAGEREACGILGKIFEGSFLRSPSSGAFIGRKNAWRKDVISAGQTTQLKGDVVPPDHMLNMVLEVKSYKELRWHQLVQPNGCAQIDEWLEQCNATNDPGDEWFILMKFARISWFVAVPTLHASYYQFENHIRYSGKHGSVWISEMQSFFESNRQKVEERSLSRKL